MVKGVFFLFILTLNSFHLYISSSAAATACPPSLLYIACESKKNERNFGSVIKNIKKVIFCTDVSNPYNNFSFFSFIYISLMPPSLSHLTCISKDSKKALRNGRVVKKKKEGKGVKLSLFLNTYL